MKKPEDIRIPPIRQDLKVYKTGYDQDGAPTWTLYDPLSDNYFKIGWFEFECLKRFEKCLSANQLIASISNETTLEPDLDDIKEFISFLLFNSLLKANSADVQKIMTEQKDKGQSSFFKKTFARYMYTVIPLFKPTAFLKKVYPYIEFLYTREFFIFVLCLLSLGIFFTLQRVDDFLHTFSSFLSLEGFIFLIFSTVFVKIFHELGHAFMAHKYGIPVSTMGVALIILYPVLYTETTNAWRLSNRRDRVNIALAGVLAELTLASAALILWHVFPPGLLQNMAYFVGFVSLGLSILVNMNPFMKFDGYYLFCDLVGIDNLQSRSISYFKWHLRKILLGVDENTPEFLNKKTQNFLVLFGFGLSVYRVFLYLGISLVAYNLMFKPLGLLVASTILLLFIGAPILKELKNWYDDREVLFKKKRPKIFLGIALALVALVVVPIDTTVKIPAVLHSSEYVSIHAPIPSRITEIKVVEGDVVQIGDPLFNLSSENLDQEIEQAELSLELNKKIKSRQSFARDEDARDIIIDDVILEAISRLKGLNVMRSKLHVVSTVDGVVRDVPPQIHEGRWINSNAPLAKVVNDEGLSLTGYINDEDIRRLSNGDTGYFLADSSFFKKVKVNLVSIGKNDTKQITFPELTSLYGGTIPADNSGENINSKNPLYVLKFEPINATENNTKFTQKGVVILRVQPISIAGKIVKKVISLFTREFNV